MNHRGATVQQTVPFFQEFQELNAVLVLLDMAWQIAVYSSDGSTGREWALIPI